MLSFKPAFPLSYVTLIKRLFSSSSVSAIRVVSSAYQGLLILLLEILIPTCDLSSSAFCMMCSAYNLNKQGDHIQLWRTSFPVFLLMRCSMSSSNCCFLSYIFWIQVPYLIKDLKIIFFHPVIVLLLTWWHCLKHWSFIFWCSISLIFFLLLLLCTIWHCWSYPPS